MKPRILLARRLPPEAEAEAARRFHVVPSGPDDLDTPAALAILRDSGAAGMVLANNVLLDAATIAALPETFRIAASATVGLDHIDVSAAGKRGIVVTNTPGVLEDCTADYAFMLLLMAARRAKNHMALVADGWSRPLAMDEALGTRVSGKRLGIVGMGAIGQAMATRARGFGMSIHYHNRRRLPAEREAGATYHATLSDLIAATDFVTLHCPALANGAPLMDRQAFAHFRPGGILINTARGSLVDEAALLEALDTGRLAAAALDVFAREPSPDAAIVAHPRVVATPHVASATLETRTAMALKALDNLSLFFAGRGAPDVAIT